MDVEIWSDIACPWCYIGKRRFEKALAAFEHRDQVKVTWRSFELDPNAPAALPETIVEHLANKYGVSVGQARGMMSNVAKVAAEEGLDFKLEESRGGNTFDAHRITHLAKAHGLQHEMEERLMRAYQCESQLMSDHATLERLALEVGLPADEVKATLASDKYAAEVREDERTASQLGISGVPFFVVDRKYGASGAQPPEILGQLLRQAWDAKPRMTVVAGGDACGPDGCEVPKREP